MPMTSFKSYLLAVILACVVVAALVALQLAHVDTKALEGLVTVLIVPLLGVLIARVAAVERNTNGNTSALLKMIDDLRQDNARKAELLARRESDPDR